MSIAKIFDIDDKQIVALKTNDPAIDLHFEMEDMITKLTLNFTDDDKGFDNRDRAFDVLEEEALLGIRESLVTDLFEDEDAPLAQG